MAIAAHSNSGDTPLSVSSVVLGSLVVLRYHADVPATFEVRGLYSRDVIDTMLAQHAFKLSLGDKLVTHVLGEGLTGPDEGQGWGICEPLNPCGLGGEPVDGVVPEDDSQDEDQPFRYGAIVPGHRVL